MDEIDNLKKWRLILGGDEADGTFAELSEREQEMDQSLSMLYEYERKKGFGYGEKKGPGGGGKSQPTVARWLGDIRKYFPATVVQVLQKDAMKHPELQKKMMFEPEILEQVIPDVHLVATLLELGKLIPSKTKSTARMVIQKVVDDLIQKLEQKTVSAISGAIHKSVRNSRPRHSEMDWNATILKNLKHYQPEHKTIIAETRIGFGRKSRKSIKDIVMCLDQSGSMGTSVVYSSIFAAVLSSLPFVKTKMIAFDTEVADLTENLKDPVDLLFGAQLGGGTDINLALSYCQQLIVRPEDTIFILISDLYEGGNERLMHERIAQMVQSGLQFIGLLALNDDGTPSYDTGNAKKMAALGIPVFACTPDQFPDLMAAAIQKKDLSIWASENDIVVKH